MSVGVSCNENIKLDETAVKTILYSFDKAISENYIKLLLK